MLFNKKTPNNRIKERLKNLFSFNIAKRIALPFLFILLMMAITISLTTKSYYSQINNYSYQRDAALKQGVAANLRFSTASLIMHVHDYIINGKADNNHKFELQRTQVEDYQKKLRTFKLSKEELIILNAIDANLDSVYSYSNQIFAIQHPGSSLDAVKLMEIMDDNFEASLYRSITKLFNLNAHKIEILATQNIQKGKEMEKYRYTVFGLSILISLVVVYFSIQKISKPIRVLTKAVGEITKGNYTLRPKVLSRDEIGSLALSFSQMAETVQETINKLKESEEQYEHLFETTSDLIQTMDVDGKILFVNRAWREKLGYTKENLTNLKLEDIIQRDLLSKCDISFQKALEGQRTDNLEIKLVKQDGEIIDVEGNVFCNLKEGIPSMVACFLRDVTEQKKAEDQLKFHADLLNEIDEAVIATSQNGDITYWNKAAEKLYGWNENEVMGQNILDVIHPSVTNEDIALATASLENGESSKSGEFLCQRKNGSIFSAIVYYSPILDVHGKLIGIISISSDITKRKQKEKELLLAKEKAEESDKLKTAFINNISHEIRTPLNSILGFGQFWADSELSREEREKYFSVIKQSSSRLMETVTDYVDIAMIVSGTMEVHKKEFQIKPLLEEIMGYTKKLCSKKPIETELEVPSNSDFLSLDSDRELIRKIIKNLVDNAVKFTDKGKIIVGYRILEGYLEFFVKDTGKGIELEKLKKFFEAFTQDDTSMTRGYEGSGLGLAIAKGFVDLLNGDIWATSNNGKGSVFYFSIPYGDNVFTVLNEKTPPAFNKPKGDNKPLVLVAEDDENNFLFIEALLEMVGCDYLHALNGKEAVEICKQDIDISFVLMDIKMPVMNGLEAMKFIKEFRPNLPIIAITAYSLTGDEQKFMEAGFDGYYAKPIKKDILDKLIKKYITG